MNLVNDVPGISKKLACQTIGIARHTLYPRPKPAQRAQSTDRPVAAKPHPRALSEPEQHAVLEQLHSARFVDASPRQMVATLQSEGVMLASVSSCYRLLRAQSETTPRVLQRRPHHYAVPRLEATAINHVWTWDITKLPTLVRGVFLCVYVILDLFSRHIVGWMVSCKENAGLAKHLFKHALCEHHIDDQKLIVHQDRGSPMVAHSFRELVESQRATMSYSRPRTSNDNAFVESLFRIMKYHSSYPGKFASAEQARAWLRTFFAGYEQSPHTGLNQYAPSDVWNGQIDPIWQARQNALDAHFAQHANRYVKGAPQAPKPPVWVAINPLDGEGVTARTALATPAFFKADLPEVEVGLPAVSIDKKFS